VLKISWQQALAWRMERQLLDPIGSGPVVEVVRRLGGIQSQVPSSAELAIRVRQERSRSDDVSRALAEGRLIKTWAMRGTLHLLTPEDGGAFLSILAFGRSWERPSWERWIGMTPEHWPVFRAVVREALANGPLPRDELATAIIAEPRLSHLGDELRSGWGTLYKPLAWQGDLCFGLAWRPSSTVTSGLRSAGSSCSSPRSDSRPPGHWHVRDPCRAESSASPSAPSR
jgi:hypothetical protein